MAVDPDYFDVAVDGGALRVARWGSGDRVAVALHGITASSMAWRSIGRRLGPEWSLVAPDLRGRGASSGLPGPHGMRSHAADVAAVVEHLGAGPVVLAGHSMGGFVAVVAAAEHPELASRLLLLDGGLPLPIDIEGLDPDAVLEATLGPAIQRLSMTYPSLDAYFDFWRVHPALAGHWNDDVEAYLSYDLEPGDGERRSRCSEEAVRADGRDLLVNAAGTADALRGVKVPIKLLTAPLGLMNEPPGLQPAALVDAWRPQVADLDAECVEGTNHYTLVLDDPGAPAVVSALDSLA